MKPLRLRLCTLLAAANRAAMGLRYYDDDQ